MFAESICWKTKINGDKSVHFKGGGRALYPKPLIKTKTIYTPENQLYKLYWRSNDNIIV